MPRTVELNAVRKRLDVLATRRLEAAFLAYERDEWGALVEREAELLRLT